MGGWRSRSVNAELVAFGVLHDQPEALLVVDPLTDRAAGGRQPVRDLLDPCPAFLLG